MENFIGEIQAFPYIFAPRGWIICDGRTYPIQQYNALFALIGTAYGGNGTTNFAVPNFVGNIANSQGNGPGLTPRVLGEQLGLQDVTLTVNQMPQHNHPLALGVASAGQTAAPSNGNVALPPAGSNGFLSPSSNPPNTMLALPQVTLTGGSQAHANNQPTLALLYCIAHEGIFPSFG
jgi:microcystin-dependent protein